MNARLVPATLPSLALRYSEIRRRSERICAPLEIEDHVPQPNRDVSPPKWHLGHTAWFFETFILRAFQSDYRAFNAEFGHVFNSYYESQGERVPRECRGALSRPTVAEVLRYRAHVDSALQRLLTATPAPDVAVLVELGLQHEQQHQELLVTDLKYILGTNPLYPSYDEYRRGPLDLDAEHEAFTGSPDEWLAFDGGMVAIGHGGPGFAFDNETPRHSAFVPPCELRASVITNAEYLAFIEDGGYERFEFWHAEGWDWLRAQTLRAPLYWRPDPERHGQWLHYRLRGPERLPAQAPVTHLSYYEAHAFCQWAGWRLPTEFEWEALCNRLRPGQRWEWTSSAYQPYPGFRPAPGAVGEYNGKFMVNQQVLRGASYATPPGHARPTYRNFFQPPLRWQYTGVRPARDRG